MDQSQKMTLRHHVIENLNDTSHNQTIKQILCLGHNSYKIEPLSKWPMNKNIISKNHSKGIPQVRVISRGVETLISTNKHKITTQQKTSYQTIQMKPLQNQDLQKKGIVTKVIRSKTDQMPRTIQLRTSTSKRITRPIQKLAIPEWEIEEVKMNNIAIPELTDEEEIQQYLLLKPRRTIHSRPPVQLLYKNSYKTQFDGKNVGGEIHYFLKGLIFDFPH